MTEERELLGVVLSSASTNDAYCQLVKDSERGSIGEGMLVIVSSKNQGKTREILARIEEIEPVDESFSKGGFLTEAIREQKRIPTGLSRTYVTVKIELLFEILPSRKEIRYPPIAGDKVYKIGNIVEYSNQIFGVSKDDLTIPYGTLAGYENLPVRLDLETISMHTAIFGTTGSGKSFNYGAFIEQISNIEVVIEGKKTTRHVPLVVIDPNGDYVDYWDHFIEKGSFGAYPQVFRYVFSVESIQRNVPLMAKKDPSLFYDFFNIALNEFKSSPRELAEAIVTFYGGDITGRTLQVNGLKAVLQYIIENNLVTDLNTLFTSKQSYDNILINNVENPPKGISIHSASKTAICRQLDLFRGEIVESYKLLGRTKKPFCKDTVDDLVKNGGMIVIDFTALGAPGVPLHVKQFIVHYISYVLFQRFVHYKTREQKQKVLLFALEECQNYCPNLSRYPIGYSLARNVLQRIATQGRKFGLCLNLISQRPIFVDPVVLSMCNTYFIHKISYGDESFVKGITGGLPKSLERRLTRLERGEVIVTGQMVKSGLPLLVNIRKNVHRIVEQKAGKVEILEGLPGGNSNNE